METFLQIEPDDLSEEPASWRERVLPKLHGRSPRAEALTLGRYTRKEVRVTPKCRIDRWYSVNPTNITNVNISNTTPSCCNVSVIIFEPSCDPIDDLRTCCCPSFDVLRSTDAILCPEPFAPVSGVIAFEDEAQRPRRRRYGDEQKHQMNASAKVISSYT